MRRVLQASAASCAFRLYSKEASSIRMKKKNLLAAREPRSIKHTFLLIYLTLLLLSIAGISTVIFLNWYGSIERGTRAMSAGISRSIQKQLDEYMDVPAYANSVTQALIQTDGSDLTEEEVRFHLLLALLSTHEQFVSSFGFAAPDGAYCAVRWGEDNVPEYLHTGADGAFDPSAQSWYRVAVETGLPSFSSAGAAANDASLSIIAAHPVYAKDGRLLGVLNAQLLLNGMNANLAGLSAPHQGYAFIAEKGTGFLIANSTGEFNSERTGSGALLRHTPLDLQTPLLGRAYTRYLKTGEQSFVLRESGEKWYVQAQEYLQMGFAWISFSLYPESRLSAGFSRNIIITAVFILLTGVLAAVLFLLTTQKLFRPVSNILAAAKAYADGGLDTRVAVERDDELGKVSAVFNKMADQVQQLVCGLEETVAARTDELTEQKNQLRLILDTTAEAIFGTDLEGTCTFCNESCLRLLGYSNASELLGKDMRPLIRHSLADGSPRPVGEHPLTDYLSTGIGGRGQEDLLWRADGSCFFVEYRALAQYCDGEHTGFVVTFTDITERKKDEEKIQYLSCHDSLTGLINRRCFEQRLAQLDVPQNLPISVIFLDLNGLKLLNDVFGHSVGDELIIKAAEVLKRNCREGDLVARVGGDEFTVLLPLTDRDSAQEIACRLKAELSREQVSRIPCGMAAGVATKEKHYHRIEKTAEQAENEMYKDKTTSCKRFSKDAVQNIIKLLHERTPAEKRHSETVCRLCQQIGAAMGLPEDEIRKLREAGYLHDIGKVTLPEALPAKRPQELTEVEAELLRQHPAVGYRILNLSEDTLDLANGIYAHHECWDGSGYPKGLKGSEIPLISRVIAVADIYAQSINQEDPEAAHEKALQAVTDARGVCLDPDIADILLRVMNTPCV
ncbi:hypothetical protein SDC9_40407 [bioreactor metagenome]|uniref:Diguanylate cyclase n=1 Tax=bioreactor metagenome TaxID=1076179 RepID=A0A644VSJ6_9ZZZZ